ncbi:hypothetical protein C8Q79DRAFT_18231 [Trametes meyenii]|nr:hypothetical protein C8Q79DRAFT_18231 [Trametes meyenii]
MPSNLPPPSYNGPFTVNATVTIDAPIDKVWEILLDFPKYTEWNPFVRSQVITDKDKKPFDDQTAAEGKYLLMTVHIPATFDNSASPQTPFELITHVQPDIYRVAWKNLLPSWLIRAERWQALSTTEDGKTLYETREVFAGVGAYAIKLFIAKNLEKSFEAMAEALKKCAEEHK